MINTAKYGNDFLIFDWRIASSNIINLQIFLNLLAASSAR